MKGFFVFLSVIGTLLPLASAYGSRGALERLVYYYAYLADEIVEPDAAKRTVAPDCRGTLPNSRCNFDEFLKYIWSPTPPDDLVRPNPGVLTSDIQRTMFHETKFTSIYNDILRWTDKATQGGVTGNTDHGRLLPGSISFYDCLSRITGSIGKLDMLRMSLPDQDRDKADKIVEKGKTATMALHDFRLRDFEKYRKKALAKILGVSKETIKQTVGRNTEKLATGDWFAVDTEATIKALGENGKSRFEAADRQYRMGKNAEPHWWAVQAAEAAEELSSCKII